MRFFAGAVCSYFSPLLIFSQDKVNIQSQHFASKTDTKIRKAGVRNLNGTVNGAARDNASDTASDTVNSSLRGPRGSANSPSKGPINPIGGTADGFSDGSPSGLLDDSASGTAAGRTRIIAIKMESNILQPKAGTNASSTTFNDESGFLQSTASKNTSPMLYSNESYYPKPIAYRNTTSKVHLHTTADAPSCLFVVQDTVTFRYWARE